MAPGFGVVPAGSGAPLYTGDTEINSGVLLGAGVGLTSLGVVGTIIGVAIAGNAERTDPCYADPCDDHDLGFRAGGLVLGFVSLGMVGAGIPMIAVGARQVPELAPGTPAVRTTFWVGPGAVRLTW